MDWLAYLFLILQMYFLSSSSKELRKYCRPDKMGFIFGFFGSFCMVLFGYKIESFPMILINMVLCGFNFKGYVK